MDRPPPARQSRPWTFRIQHIPSGTSADQLCEYFVPEDRPGIEVRSLCPSVDPQSGTLTATISFNVSKGNWPRQPQLLDPDASDIDIDEDFYGLTPLNDPPEPIVADVIAVTGLGGHAFGSWACSPRHMWLRDFLAKDLPNLRILIYGYNSRLKNAAARSIIGDHVRMFKQRLLTLPESAHTQHRPIIFIGHSLGCLLIKKVLTEITSSTTASHIADVPFTVFLAAPHRGLDTLSLQTVLGLDDLSKDIVDELGESSPTLSDLNESFARIAHQLSILSCYELQPTKTLIKDKDGSLRREGPPTIMVSQNSAMLHSAKEIRVPCNEDHAKIARLKRGEGGLYPIIKGHIKHVLERRIATETSSLSDQRSMSTEFPGRRSLELQARPGDFVSSPPTNTVATQRKAHTVPFFAGEPGTDEQPHIHDFGFRTDEEAVRREATSRQSPSRANQTRAGAETSSNEAAVTAANSKKHGSREALEKWQTVNMNTGQESPQTLSAPIQNANTFTEKLQEQLSSKQQPVSDRSISNASTVASLTSIGPSTPSPVSNEAKKRISQNSNGRSSSNGSEYALENGSTGLSRDGASSPSSVKRHSWKVLELFHKPSQPERPAAYEFLKAAAENNVDLLRDLYEQGAELESRVSQSGNCTALHEAATHNCREAAEFLIKEGAKKDFRSKNKSTPLHEAAFAGSTEVAILLIRAGAHLEAKNLADETPLLLASIRGHTAIVKELLDHGADFNSTSSDGKTALQTAQSKGHKEIEQILRARGARMPRKKTTDTEAPQWPGLF
ncbi:MAG: hypothetical protein M1822_004122 [Bathelium mastoideum]|nr:MAG: hypothetical protein M1822_004122 [Bathelium mastoideum]